MKHFFSHFTETFSDWWWSIDRTLFVTSLVLIGFGIFMTFSASPSVADRYHFSSYHFIVRQLIFLGPALFILIACSFLSPRSVRWSSFFLFLLFLMLLMLVPFKGIQTKGSSRWLSILGVSIQPSEFLKPCFAVVIACLLAKGKTITALPAKTITIGIFLFIALFLFMQPDIGMLLTFAGICGVELFLAGLNYWLVGGAVFVVACAVLLAFFTLNHVHDRIIAFLTGSGDTYQVDRALETFQNAGWFGTGPGEGIAKVHLPDAHTDFILATAAEEFGFLISSLIIILFAVLIYRGFSLNKKEQNLFVILATSGILTQIGVQSIINMASSMHLIPTKGMTLPFISYGGSSLCSVAFAMGIILALTRSNRSEN